MAVRTDPLRSAGDGAGTQQTHAKTRRELLAEMLPSLRGQLEAQRTFRREQLADLGASTGTGDGDSAERRAIDAELERAARWALDEVEAAIERIERGTYGCCEGCQEPIALERLEIIPHARFCPECQQRDAAEG